MVTQNIEIPIDKITDFCERWKIQEFALFGSVLRNNFNPNSDIDVLVNFSSDNSWTLFDYVDMQNELKVIFGREVDLVSKKGIERSQNHLRKNHILDSAKVIYAASGS
ncbi:MAG: nucleotidyltransferase family protein [Cyanobacteria bacterium P01_F01_bin.143]